MGGPGSGAKPKDYPPALVEMVADLYGEGHTMREVADMVGTTVKVLQRLMPRYDIPRRTAAKRCQVGEHNGSWKGDAAGYQAMHLRVATLRGAPSKCSACERSDEARYEWANLTGRYYDPHDYIRLCVPCHRRYDAQRRKEVMPHV